MGRIEHIYISPNRGEPMIGIAEAEAIKDGGLRGDRYSNEKNRRSPDYQVTLIELEFIEAFSREYGLPLLPHEPRRNLVTVGVRLNELCGKRFFIGSAEFEGLELCEPCTLLAKRTYAEALSFFVHKGGLRCRVIQGGQLKVGNEVLTNA